LENSTKSKDDCEVDDEPDIEPGKYLTALESQEYHVVSREPHVPGLILPIQSSMKQAEKWLLTVSAMETRRNKGNNNK